MSNTKVKINCVNCGKTFKRDNLIFYPPSRGDGKFLTHLYFNVRNSCCSEKCARELWKHLYDEVEERMIPKKQSERKNRR